MIANPFIIQEQRSTHIYSKVLNKFVLKTFKLQQEKLKHVIHMVKHLSNKYVFESMDALRSFNVNRQFVPELWGCSAKSEFHEVANELANVISPTANSPIYRELSTEKKLAVTLYFLKDTGSLSMTATIAIESM